jgi:hypothetical protein
MPDSSFPYHVLDVTEIAFVPELTWTTEIGRNFTGSSRNQGLFKFLQLLEFVVSAVARIL